MRTICPFGGIIPRVRARRQGSQYPNFWQIDLDPARASVGDFQFGSQQPEGGEMGKEGGGRRESTPIPDVLHGPDKPEKAPVIFTLPLQLGQGSVSTEQEVFAGKIRLGDTVCARACLSGTRCRFGGKKRRSSARASVCLETSAAKGKKKTVCTKSTQNVQNWGVIQFEERRT